MKLDEVDLGEDDADIEEDGIKHNEVSNTNCPCTIRMSIVFKAFVPIARRGAVVLFLAYVW